MTVKRTKKPRMPKKGPRLLESFHGTATFIPNRPQTKLRVQRTYPAVGKLLNTKAAIKTIIDEKSRPTMYTSNCCLDVSQSPGNAKRHDCEENQEAQNAEEGSKTVRVLPWDSHVHSK